MAGYFDGVFPFFICWTSLPRARINCLIGAEPKAALQPIEKKGEGFMVCNAMINGAALGFRYTFNRNDTVPGFLLVPTGVKAWYYGSGSCSIAGAGTEQGKRGEDFIKSHQSDSSYVCM